MAGEALSGCVMAGEAVTLAGQALLIELIGGVRAPREASTLVEHTCSTGEAVDARFASNTRKQADRTA